MKSQPHDAIVMPRRGKQTPMLGPLALIVSTQSDLEHLCTRFKIEPQRYQQLYLSRCYFDNRKTKSITLVGPVIGAPYAAMLLETLAAWGVRSIIFFGWCGAVSRDVNVGDIVVPSSAMIDEGTSLHYGFSQNDESYPGGIAPGRIAQTLEQAQIPFHRGPVWSTDGVFRETPEKVRQYRQKGVLAVDMETSAVFSVGNFRKVEAAAVLAVSDDLSDLRWHPGFKDPRFLQARQNIYRILGDVCRKQLIRLS